MVNLARVVFNTLQLCMVQSARESLGENNQKYLIHIVEEHSQSANVAAYPRHSTYRGERSEISTRITPLRSNQAVSIVSLGYTTQPSSQNTWISERVHC
jgi:hypothetical protein